MMEKLLGMQPNASVRGPEIDALIIYLHWLMLALFVGWGIFFIYTLIRFRSSKNPVADYTGVTSHASSYLEVAVAFVEVVLLIGFSIPIWAKAVGQFPKEQDAVVIRVLAQQFAWNFHYAGADGKFGKSDSKFVDEVSNPLGLDMTDSNAKDDISTINQMYVPTGKPVIIKILSKDVIHSFGVPALRVKQDAVPGMEVPIWFEANKLGTYEIACSQLCGSGHYSMRGFVQVKAPQDFDKWLADEGAKKAQEGAGGGGDSFWN